MTMDDLKMEFSEAVIKKSSTGQFYITSPRLGLSSAMCSNAREAYDDFERKLEEYLRPYIESENYFDLPLKSLKGIHKFKRDFTKILTQSLALLVVLILGTAIFSLALSYQLKTFHRNIEKIFEETPPKSLSKIELFDQRIESNRPYIRKIITVINEEYLRATVANPKK